MSGPPRAGREAPHGAVLVREVVRPVGPFRLGRASMDGLLRRRGDGLIRLLHVEDSPVVVAVAQPSPERVVFAARAASSALAREGIARMRFVVGVDDDLREFRERFAGDPVIGAAVRAHPGLRVRRTPTPWETLQAAITEQLIEFERAVLIQRRMIHALGRRCARTGLRDAPGAEVTGAQAPALLESFGLAAKRAIALRRAAIEVAAGRVPALRETPGGASSDAATVASSPRAAGGASSPRAAGGASSPRAAGGASSPRAATVAGPPLADLFARLLAIREIGPWTVEMTALHGLGRLDAVPAGDLGYLELVGALRGRRVEVPEVREFFEPYAPYAGIAGHYLRLSRIPSASRRPTRPAGTRSSAAAMRRAAA